VIEFAAALCLIVALILGALLLRAHKQLYEARFAWAVLDTVPLTWTSWSGCREPRGTRANAAQCNDILARLSAEDAAQMAAYQRALQSDGIPFSTSVAGRNGARYRVEGRRAATGDAVLWLADDPSAATAAEAQREARSLRQMLDAIPMPVWRRSADRRIVDCNRAYASAVDATPELVRAEGRELARAFRPSERRHIVIGGSRRLLALNETVCATGETFGFAVDQTDLESAEAELWRHINAHAEVLEHIRAAVAIYGPDRRLKFFNSAFSSMWGIAEDWLAAQRSFEEVLERLREARCLPEAANFKAFKTEQVELFTTVIEPRQELMHLPDGRTLLLSISPHPFGGLTFVYEDVSDRLALERSCNTLTQVRRATLDHLFEGIAVYGSDGRLKLHNPAYLAIWGLSQRDVEGEPHIAQILEKTRKLIDDGSDWEATKERIIAKVTAHALASGPVYRTDGSMLQEAAVPLPDGNVLVTYLDVTDTTKYERALRERNEALETAGRLKSEFVANVSHELRTPLNAIIGFAEVLTNQYFGDLNPRQLDYTRGILQSSQHLLKLINDILDLATIEAGFMAPEIRPIEVYPMLQDVLHLTRERAANRDLDIELDCPLDIGVITADERQLKQALFNLISNAIKFTPPGGAIRIAAQRQENAMLLSVADTGVGIAPSDQARMFEKFERGARHSGAGLGLALVKSVIELHRGIVKVETATGQGTRIICRLPASERDLIDPNSLLPPVSRAATGAAA
jgi:signal transduction histidine kinase